MATITIDGRQYEVDETDNVLKVALSKGFDLPYFCWHPELHSVGACRQCAVKQYKDENDTQGQIAMACMTPASDGARFSVADDDAAEMRAQVVEWLMINHPHDCPVCEEGGECHLQDMTLMTGHTRRRYTGAKRTHRNQDLGPFISHEMNRCIACYRCVRYYRDYADDNDLRALGSHMNVYFGRESDGPFENEFSGNLVEVCPTGVFTDKTLGAQYIRKWDMQNAPSICTHCSLGCNTSPGSRKGELKRIQNRYHGEINHYFLCDRGRFGAGFVTREDRPRQPLARDANGVLEPVAQDEALATVRQALAGGRAIGVGSPRSSLEDNYALRHLVGGDHFVNGMSGADTAASHAVRDLLSAHTDRVASLRETENCDAVFVIGEDVTQTAPRLALSLRQAAKNKHFELAKAQKIPKWHARAVRDEGRHNYSPIFQATPAATRLDDVTLGATHADADGIAALAFAVAHALDANAPAPDGLDDALTEHANDIAEALKSARKPLIVVGTGLGHAPVVEAAGNVMSALAAANDATRMVSTLMEANSLGMAMLDAPSVDGALDAIESGQIDTLVVNQNDLYERAPASRVDAALRQLKSLVVLDHSLTRTTARADSVLPSGSFAESDGTLINNEGRAQRFFQVFIPEGPMQEAWRWCADLARALERPVRWNGMDDLIAGLVADLPQFTGIEDAAPSQSFRKAGMRFPRSPHRNAARTALYADVDVRERRPEVDADSPLSYSMEGYYGTDQPSELLAYAWAPGWESNQQAITRFQDEVGGNLKKGDPGVHVLAGGGDSGYRSVPGTNGGDHWRVVPRHHIFDSEPLSARAPAIAERVDSRQITLNRQSTEALGVADGDNLSITLDGDTLTLPVAIDESLPARVIGIPIGAQGAATVHAASRVDT
ncbi:NADH-quinone oxidoreductase subunit NuoG [Salinisphaera orenii]|uniref:NADH-quinone oxidoreductase subunit NuoG n=1 Tax=Salinisphaera orenii TaxID=856731 RepID=UPI000DBE6231